MSWSASGSITAQDGVAPDLSGVSVSPAEDQLGDASSDQYEFCKQAVEEAFAGQVLPEGDYNINLSGHARGENDPNADNISIQVTGVLKAAATAAGTATTSADQAAQPASPATPPTTPTTPDAAAAPADAAAPAAATPGGPGSSAAAEPPADTPQQ